MYEHPNPAALLVLGETTWRGAHRRFGIHTPDRLRHLWTLGKTGAGKSTLLLNLLAQDFAHGRGVGLLDPHGQLALDAAALVPRRRLADVCWLDPSDGEAAVAFNIFRQGADLSGALVAASLVSVFKKHWAEFWGPRLEHILRSALLALAPDPNATLVSLYRFLTDEKLRSRLAPRIGDPVVRRFWEVEFPSYKPAMQAEALSPVLNKLGAFLSQLPVRRVVGQTRSKLDIARVMDRSSILLCNLSVGHIGEDASHLLGSLIVSSVQLAAMRRRPQAPPFFLYLDEFQHFVTDSLATMLSEARKYGVGLVLAHQYLGQLTRPLADALRGNAGTIAWLRLGAADAEALAGEVAPPFTAADLCELPAHHAVMRVVVRGVATPAFSARLLPPPLCPSQPVPLDEIISASRQRFSTPVLTVDRWVERTLAG